MLIKMRPGRIEMLPVLVTLMLNELGRLMFKGTGKESKTKKKSKL